MATDRHQSELAATGGSRGDGWVVLLVEDDLGDARLLREMLGRSGQRVDLRVAGTLAAAVEALAAEPVDVVLGDLGLPDAQGMDVVDRLVDVATDVPLVVLTGLQDRPDVAVEAVRRGAQDYLVKGEATSSDVERSLRFAMERHRLRRLVTKGVLQAEALSQIESRGHAAATVQGLLEVVVAAVEEAQPRTRLRLAVETADGESTQGGAPPESARDAWRSDRWEVAGAGATGELGIFSPAGSPLSDHERTFFARVAQMTTRALDALATDTDLRLRKQQLRMLYELSRQLAACTDVEEVLDLVPNLVLEATSPDPSCHVALVIEDTTGVAGTAPTDTVDQIRAPLVVDGQDVGALVVQRTHRPATEGDHVLVGQVAELVEAWITRRRAEQERDERRRWMELLLEQLPAAVWSIDTEMQFTSVAGSGLAALEGSPHPGQPLTDYFGPDTESLPVREHRRALDGHQTRYSFWWQDRWWQVVIGPLHDRDGVIIGALGVSLDATEQRNAQQQAERERQRYQALFERSLDAIVLTDDSGRFIEVNPAMCALLDMTRQELLGLRAADLAPDDVETERLLQQRSQLLRNGELRGRVPLARSDATVVEVEFSAAAGIVDEANLSILRDVTQQARLERELLANEQRFRALAENAVEGIFRIALLPERAYEYVNPAFERLTGYSMQDVVDDDTLLRRRTHPNDVVHDITPEPHTQRFQRADDQWRWLEVRQTPIRDDEGTVVAVQGLILDVTDHIRHADALQAALQREQHAAEELRRLDGLKSAFLRAASHELRTPLTAVYGIAATLHDHHDRLDLAAADHLWERLEANVERLRILLDDLLDIDRLTTSHVIPILESTDLAEIARTTTDEVSLGHHTLHLDLAPTPATVEPSKVARILHNLLGNAVKHTPAGTTITVTTHPGPDGAAVLIVADDGPGIDPDIRDRLFEPFVQGAHTAASAQPGTGIGLTLVRQFTELHNGTIETDTPTSGTGTRFQVTFPPRLLKEPD